MITQSINIKTPKKPKYEADNLLIACQYPTSTSPMLFDIKFLTVIS